MKLNILCFLEQATGPLHHHQEVNMKTLNPSQREAIIAVILQDTLVLKCTVSLQKRSAISMD